ncbi:MAG: hypothetical protein IT381_00085 [Deltaproteobacteria bacterium]|nr:hypothetical protein [Deltaproteobacteria bacterium]
MNSWLTTGAQLNYGQQLADGKIGQLAHGILMTCAIVALATAAVRYSLDRQAKNPLAVLPWAAGLLLLLHLYGYVVTAIDGSMREIAASISDNGAFSQFLNNWVTELGKRFSFDVSGATQRAADGAAQITQEDASALDRIRSVWNTLGIVGDEASSFTTAMLRGALSGLLALLSAFFSIVFFEVFSVLRVTLFQVLYAVGPLVIAFSILPGASSILGRWFTAVFEICSWQVIGAIVFELVAKSSSAAAFTSNSDNFVAFCVANVVFVCSILLIPIIAHRIVGSGFGAVGQTVGGMMLAGVAGGVALAKPYAQRAMQAASAAAKPYVTKGATVAADAIRAKAPRGSLAESPDLAASVAAAPRATSPQQVQQVTHGLMELAAEQQEKAAAHRSARREPIDAVAFADGGGAKGGASPQRQEASSAEQLFSQMSVAKKYVPPAAPDPHDPNSPPERNHRS